MSEIEATVKNFEKWGFAHLAELLQLIHSAKEDPKKLDAMGPVLQRILDLSREMRQIKLVMEYEKLGNEAISRLRRLDTSCGEVLDLIKNQARAH
jgi:hypothetical protein